MTVYALRMRRTLQDGKKKRGRKGKEGQGTRTRGARLLSRPCARPCRQKPANSSSSSSSSFGTPARAAGESRPDGPQVCLGTRSFSRPVAARCRCWSSWLHVRAHAAAGAPSQAPRPPSLGQPPWAAALAERPAGLAERDTAQPLDNGPESGRGYTLVGSGLHGRRPHCVPSAPPRLQARAPLPRVGPVPRRPSSAAEAKARRAAGAPLDEGC